MKRNFREAPTISRTRLKFLILFKKLKRDKNPIPKIETTIRKNHPLIAHFFSLTALYHLFSNYGESIIRPTIIGAVTVGLSTLFWLMQSEPTLEPHFFYQ